MLMVHDGWCAYLAVHGLFVDHGMCDVDIVCCADCVTCMCDAYMVSCTVWCIHWMAHGLDGTCPGALINYVVH